MEDIIERMRRATAAPSELLVMPTPSTARGLQEVFAIDVALGPDMSCITKSIIHPDGRIEIQDIQPFDFYKRPYKPIWKKKRRARPRSADRSLRSYKEG